MTILWICYSFIFAAQAGGPITGMDFVSLPGGTFQMGCVENTSQCGFDEKVHTVTLTPFEIMTTEVTQGIWKDVMGSNPSEFSACGDNCPVEKISWNDAQIFIDKLNQVGDGFIYRLPTEAEWEYSARGGTSTEYSTGDGESALEQVGWYQTNSGAQTHLVAQKLPNVFGIYDMHGNVSEWVSDWYAADYGHKKKDPSGPVDGDFKVIRGGSWKYDAGYARSGSRSYADPAGNWNSIGFRVVRRP